MRLGRSLGNILIVAGMLGVVFGFGSLLYPILQPAPPVQQSPILRPGQRVQQTAPSDSDGAWQLVSIAQKYVIGIGGGMLAIAVGGYIRSLKTRKSDEHDTTGSRHDISSTGPLE